MQSTIDCTNVTASPCDAGIADYPADFAIAGTVPPSVPPAYPRTVRLQFLLVPRVFGVLFLFLFMFLFSIIIFGPGHFGPPRRRRLMPRALVRPRVTSCDLV